MCNVHRKRRLTRSALYSTPKQKERLQASFLFGREMILCYFVCRGGGYLRIKTAVK